MLVAGIVAGGLAVAGSFLVAHRRRVARLAREADRNMAAAAQAVGATIAIVSPRGRLLKWASPDSQGIPPVLQPLLDRQSTCDEGRYWLGQVRTAAASGQPVCFELQDKDQAQWYENRLVALNKTQVMVLCRDVTAAKRTARAIETHLQQLDIIAQSMRDLVTLHDFEGRILYASPAVKELTGYTVEEVLGRNGFDFLPEEDASFVRHAIQLRVRSQDFSDLTVQYRLIKKGGAIGWFETRTRALLGEDGRIHRFVHSTREITDAFEAQRALAEREGELKTLTENMRGIVLMCDAAGVVQFISPSVTEILGWQPEEWIGRPACQMVYIADRPLVLSISQRQLRENRDSDTFQWRAHCKDGAIRWMESLLRVVRQATGEVRLIATTCDIEQRKEVEDRLALSQLVSDCASDAMLLCDVRGRITWVNKAFSRISGYTFEEVRGILVGRLMGNLVPGATRNEIRQDLDSFGTWQGELWARRKTGESFPLWCRITGDKEISGGKNRHFVCIFSDLTQQVNAREAIWRLSSYDAVTGLPNQQLARDTLSHAIARARRNNQHIGVAVLDVHRFRRINEFGHETGDRLLKGIGRRLLDSVKEMDTVARLDGDRFVIIFEGLADVSDLDRILHRLQTRFADPFDIGKGRQSVRFVLNFGAACYPSSGGTADALLQGAMEALLAAKAAGPGEIRWHSRRDTAKTPGVPLENALIEAVRADALDVVFQLRYCLRTGQPAAAEALAHWAHPAFGAVPREKFLSLAEDIGFIHALDERVYLKACRAARVWQDTLPLSLTLNVPVQELRSPHLTDKIMAILRKAHLPAQCLELGIQASALRNAPAGAHASLAALKAAGVSLTLENFGGDDCNLLALQDLPLNRVKLSPELLADAEIDGRRGRLLSVLCEVGRTLDVKVIATGVETPRQLSLCEEAGLDEVQGPLLAPVVAETDLLRMLPKSIDVDALLGRGVSGSGRIHRLPHPRANPGGSSA